MYLHLRLVLAIIAVVFFALDALQVQTPRVNKQSAGWAFALSAFFFA